VIPPSARPPSFHFAPALAADASHHLRFDR
jgi:hypothetical protein